MRNVNSAIMEKESVGEEWKGGSGSLREKKRGVLRGEERKWILGVIQGAYSESVRESHLSRRLATRFARFLRRALANFKFTPGVELVTFSLSLTEAYDWWDFPNIMSPWSHESVTLSIRGVSVMLIRTEVLRRPLVHEKGKAGLSPKSCKENREKGVSGLEELTPPY